MVFDHLDELHVVPKLHCRLPTATFTGKGGGEGGRRRGGEERRGR
jgi:hypothetical protein